MRIEPGQHGLSIRFTKHGGSNVERLTAVLMVTSPVTHGYQSAGTQIQHGPYTRLAGSPYGDGPN